MVSPRVDKRYRLLMTGTAILRILLADEQLGDDVNVHTLAKRTESFSGSDLKRTYSNHVYAPFSPYL